MEFLPEKGAEPVSKHAEKDMDSDPAVRPMEDRPDGKEIRVLHLSERALHMPCATVGLYDLAVSHIAPVSEQGSLSELFFRNGPEAFFRIGEREQDMIILFKYLVFENVCHVFPVVQDPADGLLDAVTSRLIAPSDLAPGPFQEFPLKGQQLRPGLFNVDTYALELSPLQFRVMHDDCGHLTAKDFRFRTV